MTSEESGEALARLSGCLAFEGVDRERIDFIEAILEVLFRVGRQTRKLDPMPAPGSLVRITADVVISSESIQKSTPRLIPSEGQSVYHLAAVAANVSGIYPHRRVDSLVAYFRWKRDSVSGEPPAVGTGAGKICSGLS